MSWLVGLAVSAVAGMVGSALVRLVDGTCPAAAQTLLCAHWDAVAGVGASILGALGYAGNRYRQQAAKTSRPVLLTRAVPELEPQNEGVEQAGPAAGSQIDGGPGL